MAQKFGGKYSPSSTPVKNGGPERAPGLKAGNRARLMFIAPLPLLVAGFAQISAQDSFGVIRYFGGFAVLALAAWLLQEGLKAEAAFNARPNAGKPALPRKVLAAGLSGAALAFVIGSGAGMVFSLLIGALAGILHLVAFGIDPVRNKTIGAGQTLSGRRVARAVTEAEDHIAAMIGAIEMLNDQLMSERLTSFVTTARAMFRTVEQDPRDLVSARKYLGVYLKGARDATLKFVSLYQKTQNPEIRANYQTLLGDLEKNFDAQRRELLLDDRDDLDVEIEVLRQRLRNEGVET